MKRYKIISLFNPLISNPILLVFLTFLFLITYNKLLITSIFVCTYIWMIRTKDRSWILFVCLLCVLSIPRYQITMPTTGQAKVVRVRSSYSILQDHNLYFIVYHDEPFHYDDIYAYDGTFEEITSQKGFYAFQYGSWANQEHCYYSTDEQSLSLMKEGNSFLHHVQYKIESLSNIQEKTILQKVLLNISNKDESDAWYFQNGFTYSGLCSLLSIVLSYFLDEKKQRKVMIGILLIIWYTYHYPLLIFYMLVHRLLQYTKLSYVQKGCMTIWITMVVYPSKITSITFLISTIIRLSRFIKDHQKCKMYFYLCIVQSIFFHEVNLVQSFCFRYMQKIFGVMYWIAIVDLLFSTHILCLINPCMQLFYQCMDRFVIYGSCIGFTLPFYILLCVFMKKYKYCDMMRFGVFILLLMTGLFHPLGEVTCINVGQGDATLIRMPLNSCNILIDTGKPSAQNQLITYLHAKGITHLNGLIITHSDDDHSGNQEVIIEQFHPDTVITSHTLETKIKNITLYDLNELQTDDENQSSIVSAFTFNGLTMLWMGDCDQYGESKIIEKYGLLNVDILRLGHHGSATSTSDILLDTMQPKLGLISSGPYAIYHHPSYETIQKLLQRHIPYFDTKEEGDISILSIAKWNIMITSNYHIALL